MSPVTNSGAENHKPGILEIMWMIEKMWKVGRGGVSVFSVGQHPVALPSLGAQDALPSRIKGHPPAWETEALRCREGPCRAQGGPL